MIYKLLSSLAFTYGHRQEQAGRWQQAIYMYKKALYFRPNADGTWHVRLARTAERIQDWPLAASAYHSATTAPGKAKAGWFYGLGSSYEQQELWSQALAAYQQALALRPNASATWHISVARTAEHLQNWPLAALAYRSATAIPGKPKAVWFYRLGFAYEKQQLWPDALAAYQEALARRPTADGMWHLSVAKTAERLHDAPLAAAEYRLAKTKRQVGNVSITLDLSNPHERRYADCLAQPRKYPQYDIDRLLMQRFVRSGDTVLDAGANIGLVSLHFLEQGAKRVLAVEPIPNLAQRIRDLQDTRIVCLQKALSNQAGEVEFFISKSHNQGSTYDKSWLDVFPHVYGENHETIRVETITIDSLAEKFDIWKLDIEGAEWDAVCGGRKTLSQSPPRIILAELYEHKFEEFRCGMKEWFPFIYRAGILRENYSLQLLPPDEFLIRHAEFHEISPTYVFSLTSQA